MFKIMRQIAISVLLVSLFHSLAFAAKTKSDENKPAFSESTFSNMAFRNIGPGFMSGRIADIAIHPTNKNLWYVAVGSGGVWKTENAGTTWTPIFDQEAVYSIGAITIDPNNPSTIWVGSGENVGGRHVGFGDGVYKSTDAGKSWKNMGLLKSQHISEIVVHPENSNIVWVAAQGPLWSSGGERGLYMSENGGETWTLTLSGNKWTGVTDIAIDPRNPDRLYAATWQRHRSVAAYIGGGPDTGLHRSEDGGKTWTKLSSGLPKANMGKIGLAISPQNPDVLYAAIELERRKGGVYRSSDRGSHWELMSDTVSGGTGPHYYQELYASPHKFDLIYLADVRMQVSHDGGKTFVRMKEDNKHSDNHALAFREDDPNYLLVGTDGGLYESFDQSNNWKYISNLPITQYYKLALDDAEPFYNIYGGTQDNNTQGGPSRTDNRHGIDNGDWFITVFGDGHQPATEPGNPDILYSQWQQGNLMRVDRTTGEVVYVQPQPEAGEDSERWNWDAPILVSPHSPTRLYFASQHVWRSDDRGDSWQRISGDLTKDENRLTLPIMGDTQSWDNAWDIFAMSNYNTITSLAESPVKEGVIYAGTDDGLIQVTLNGGQSWRKVPVSKLPDVPKTAFVNDIKADLFDADTVYITLDNHKYGDFTPYVLKSTNAGKSWKNMSGDLPDKHLAWRIVQDHVNKELFFLATEFGVFFSVNSGEQWLKLTGGTPTISFRDLAIQRRENDLVGASFGRGFFVLDDYSPLRSVSKKQMEKDAILFDTRPAWWYVERPKLDFNNTKGSQGEAYYTAPNPDFGAVFTYYLKDDLKTLKDLRQDKEKKLVKAKKSLTFPDWEDLQKEVTQDPPKVWLTVKDSDGNVVRRLEAPSKKGMHRVSWDLTFPATTAIGGGSGFYFSDEPIGMLALPGQYEVSLSKQEGSKVTQLAEPKTFDVRRLRSGALAGKEPAEIGEFWQRIAAMQRSISAFNNSIANLEMKLTNMETALSRSLSSPGDLDAQLHQIRQKLHAINKTVSGNAAKNQIGEKNPPSINSRLFVAIFGTSFSTYGPTPTHIRSMEIAEEEYAVLKGEFESLLTNDVRKFEAALQASGAPWVEGMPIP
ncbi:MAG: glycosyl hydrolase [Glaciecola sp.]